MTPPQTQASIQVQFAVPFAYEVRFTCGLFEPENDTLLDVVCRGEPTRRHRLLVVVETRVAEVTPGLQAAISAYVEAHRDHLQLVSEALVLQGGEACKNSAAGVERLYRAVADTSLDRQSFVVAVGGGAFLDMVGFAAATAHRGVRLIRVPTTVLAQNDSGVGVKNGVNFHGLKNFSGTFAVPHAVLNDHSFLKTLTQRDRVSGLAEAVKVSLIKDRDFFFWMESSVEPLAAFEEKSTNAMIRRCAQLHTEHIAAGGDPFEQGSARPLDFGHWSAHKLESLSRHRLRHGEAVAIGIALDVRYGVLAGLLSSAAAERVVLLLEGLGFALWAPELEARDESGQWLLETGLDEFREHLGGELSICMLRELGRAEEVHTMDKPRVRQAVAWLKQRAGVEGSL